MKNNQLGFTLFELIVVIGIIALLSGGVLFSFSKFQKASSLEKSLTDIKSTLTQGRESVRKGGCKDMLITFGKVNSDGSTSVTAVCQSPIGSATIPVANVPSGITGNSSVSFHLINNGLGGLSVNSTNLPFTITLSKQGESSQALVLDQTKILYGPF